jgi:RNA polymerase sigma-54 factor
MVSVLALNKLELRDMITAEMVENPVLEEFDPAVPLLDEVGGREEARDRAATAEETVAPAPEEKKDPFEEIDLDSYFRDYLDPGYRTHAEIENVEKPSFENFLSKPATLTDHLMWQLGSIIVKPEVREAAVAVIGNLDDDGYLVATDDELMGTAPPQLETKPEPRSLDHSEEEHEVKAAEEAEIAAAEEPGFVAEADQQRGGSSE